MASANFFQQSYDELVKTVKNQPLNALTAINFVTKAMQIVEKGKDLNGPEKKQLVIDLIIKLINETPLDDALKANLRALPYSAIIDTIVAATKSQLKINDVVADMKEGKACGCFGGK